MNRESVHVHTDGRMARKPSPFVIFASFFVCILLNFIMRRTSVPETVKIFNVIYIGSTNDDHTEVSIENSTIVIADILNGERTRYVDGLKGYYHFTEEKVGLTSLTPETNGRPIQSCKLCSFSIKT